MVAYSTKHENNENCACYPSEHLVCVQIEPNYLSQRQKSKKLYKNNVSILYISESNAPHLKIPEKTRDGANKDVWLITLEQVNAKVLINITKNTGKDTKSTEFELDDFAKWKGQLSKAGVVRLKISGDQSHLTAAQAISLYQLLTAMTDLNNVLIQLSETASTLSQLVKVFKHMPKFITLTVTCRTQIWADNFNFIDAFDKKGEEFKFRKLHVNNITLKCIAGYNIKKLEEFRYQTTDVEDFEANLKEIIYADSLQFRLMLLDQQNKRVASLEQILDNKEKTTIASDGSKKVEMCGILYSMDAVATTLDQCEHIMAARKQRNFINHFDIRVSTDKDDLKKLFDTFWKKYRSELKNSVSYNVDHIYTTANDHEDTLCYIEKHKKSLQATFTNGKFYAPLTDAESINVNFIGFEEVSVAVEDEIINWFMGCVIVVNLEIHGKVSYAEKVIDKIQSSRASKVQVVLPWQKLETILTRFNDDKKVLVLFTDFLALFDITLSTNNKGKIAKIKSNETVQKWSEHEKPPNRKSSQYMLYQFVDFPKIERLAAALARELGRKT